MTPPSLLGRVIVRLSLVSLAAIACAYGWLWWEFRTNTETLRSKSMISTARSIAATVRVGADGRLEFHLPAGMTESFDNSGGAWGFAIRDQASSSVLKAAGAWVGPLPLHIDDDDDGQLYLYNPDGPGPDSWSGEALPLVVNGQPLVVQVVQRSSDYQVLTETILGDFLEDGGWVAAPFLLVLLLVSLLTVRQTLAPLLLLSRQAASIGPAATDVRLPLAGIPREFVPLVTAVNHAFERLDDGFRLQREFTADAAHELRTPLAVLTAHVDTLEDRKVAASLRGDIMTMTHMVEQLLRVARAEAILLEAGDKTDLCALAREVAAWLAPMAIRQGKMLEVEAPEEDVMVCGQQDPLFHAVRNLADNALRHSPPGAPVILSVTRSPLQLTVRDFGPGVPASQREAIFRRFWRTDRRVGGAGLGLSIVQRTMQAHGGQALCEDAEGGGALFRLVFPESSPVPVPAPVPATTPAPVPAPASPRGGQAENRGENRIS